MNYKAYIYMFFLLLSVFALSGINFEKIMKKNKIYECWALVILLSLAFAYLATAFVTGFFEVSKII